LTKLNFTKEEQKQIASVSSFLSDLKDLWDIFTHQFKRINGILDGYFKKNIDIEKDSSLFSDYF